LSIKLCQVWAAFRRPKVMNINLNRPNEVEMMVFKISSGTTGIWINAFAKSTTLKMVKP
jgi:hypothetical protein